MGKDHGPSIQDDDRYEALREEGMSKEKADGSQHASPGDPGQGRTRVLLGLDQGTAVREGEGRGVEGRSGMTKRELIHALRG